MQACESTVLRPCPSLPDTSSPLGHLSNKSGTLPWDGLGESWGHLPNTRMVPTSYDARQGNKEVMLLEVTIHCPYLSSMTATGMPSNACESKQPLGRCPTAGRNVCCVRGALCLLAMDLHACQPYDTACKAPAIGLHQCGSVVLAGADHQPVSS